MALSNNIKNPLIINQTITEEDIKDVFNIYILANNSNTIINSAIYYYIINSELYDEISKNIILIKAPKELLKNKIHMSKANIVPKYIIERFNKSNYILDENKNIILMILNVSKENIYIYMSQYEKKNTLINFNKKLLLNNYFLNKKRYLKDILILNESNYWVENFYNVNLTSKFNNLEIKKSLKFRYDLNNTNENYIEELNTQIIENEIINFKINYNNTYNKKNILELLSILCENSKEEFMIICYLLISKNYSNLILNNYELLIKYKDIFKKYAQLFRYLIGYAWSNFYFEECTKKSFITKNDKFIFDINTASELPIFPFSINNPKLNPYMTIYVNDNVLNSDNNIGGVINFVSEGIANLPTFLKNLNIFCTGNENNNLFENINFKDNKIAIGGSVICACIQKYNPLIKLFNKELIEEDKIKRYYNEYYANSDIDIMFQTNDNFDFMKKVIKVYNQIIINICKFNSYAEPNHIKLYSIKILYIFVDYNDITKIIKDNYDKLLTYITDINNINLLDKTSKIFNYIKVNLNKEDIIKLFDNLINEEIIKYLNNNSSQIINEYPDFFDFSNLTKIIKFNENDFEKSRNYESKIIINYKYKIKSPFIDHDIEMFKIAYDDFFATVHKFHLPCVRAYYDGDNVYLTPSCITAHLTLMNIDYSYFSGLAEPYEIINKYRMRGFGTYLNENEKNKLLNYSKNNVFWNNLYDITNYNDNYGILNLNYKIFQPRLYNVEYYHDKQIVDLDKGYNINQNIKTEYTIKEYFEEINKINKISNNDIIINIFNKLYTIGNDGSILPIKKWVIEASYDLLN
jgi:hypothetical protein